MEKKSPLVMPPEFSKLPIPQNNDQDINSNQETIKDLLNKNDDQTEILKENTNESFEKTLLEKIQKN